MDTLAVWRNPGPAFRGKPFWCWNHKLERDELLRQLAVFKEMGMGGAFLHSRTGLITEYLGDEWFALVNACADHAAELGLEAWLYDEDRWPSGSAGGLATRDERLRMKYLRLTVVPPGTVATWPDDVHFVAAFSAVLDGLTLRRHTRLPFQHAPAPGEAVLLFSWETMAAHSFYNGAAYLDTLDRHATEQFLALTHDRYAAQCGARLGRSITGIFTDEPHRGFVLCDSHGQPGPRDTAWLLPWTPALWHAFEVAFGYDLRDHLPALFLCHAGAPLVRVKWEYMELLQRLFLENWARPLHERCRALGLQLTGHVLHEDSLGAQAVPCGSVMRYYEFMDVPGVDVLGIDNRNYWVVKQLSSAARQFAKPWLLSELYGCAGWQTTFADYKRIGDWQALFGINLRCHHLSWYAMAGEAKRDYPASIFFQSAWYRDFAAVETYFSRLHVLLQAGRPCCDVLVLNPIESAWAQIHVGWATWLSACSPMMQVLDAAYRELFTWLTEAHIDFDYGDEEHLARLATIAADGWLHLGAMRYCAVLVCGVTTLRATTLALLQQLRAAGGTVLLIGDPPSHVDARPFENVAGTILGDAPIASGVLPRDRAAVVNAVRAHSPAATDWQVDAPGMRLLSQCRRDGAHGIAVIVNPDADRSTAQATIRARACGGVRELDCLRGELHTVAAREEDGWLVWTTSFGPLQERAFMFGAAVPDATTPAPAGATTASRELAGPFAYTLDEPNICVLDIAEWRVNDGAWQPAAEVLQIEAALAPRAGVPVRGGEMVQPWAARGNTTPHLPISLRFTFDIAVLPTDDVVLLVEQPAQQRICVNGQPVPVPPQTAWFIDPCFRRIPLPRGVLRHGVNEIVLDRMFGHGADLEAIYLLGRFGVQLTGPRACLTRLPETLAVGSITAQGLPFYSGHVRYHLSAGTRGQLLLPDVAAATVTFRAPHNGTTHPAPWPPFAVALSDVADADGVVIADLALTRRNTFGPLHLVPKEQPAIGPMSFRSAGAQWSDDYQLYPAGLLRAPQVT